ncbi:hypothetical protein ACFVHB_22915 [Kitasatospora sp. NPDC127111]|uniref:hypothetical protein n=1 Tax=Kitasatospora sp. NPDC127111 TaxID=3345363 RepID=UPI00362C2C00
MAQIHTGWQQPPARPGGERVWPWLLLGAVQFALAAPMIGIMLAGGLVAGVFGLASPEGSVGTVLGLLLLLLLGPLLGLALPALSLLSPAVRRLNRAALFALHTFGLLVGTAVEYFAWFRPAAG